jgi:hypothetical protein
MSGRIGREYGVIYELDFVVIWHKYVIYREFMRLIHDRELSHRDVVFTFI